MKRIVVISICLLAAFSLLGQANAPWNTNNYKQLLLTPNSAYKKEHIKNRKPVPLPPIREADAAWSKLIWRVIDVREKINHSFYFPSTPQDDRYSLIDLLLKGIEEEGLTAYDPNDDEFKIPISIEDIKAKFGAGGSEVIQVRNQLTGELEDQEVQSGGDFSTSEVLQYMLKEQWYFDKNTSRLQVRVIGICPIRVYTRDDGEYLYEDNEEEDSGSTYDYQDEVPMQPKFRSQLFWVYFPEARPLLATHEVFNPKNDAARMSYDDLFIRRRFGSYIAQVANVFENRAISEYQSGIEEILESERIKEEILKLENDLWEY